MTYGAHRNSAWPLRSSLELAVDKMLNMLFDGHAIRVMELTADVCQAMGMTDPHLIRSAQRGAMVHDVGKVGVSDRILLKAGPLTAREWEEMKQHPRWGYLLLSANEQLRDDWPIAYCHHEKWDGTGYPIGMKGLDIPLEARAFAPIDVLDALLESRPYRPALTQAEAWAELERGRGTHFDPEALDALRRIWDARGTRWGTWKT